MLYTLFNLKASSVQFRFGFVVSTNVYTYIYMCVRVFCDRRWNSRRLSRWITVTYCRFRDFNHEVEKGKEGGEEEEEIQGKRSSILF